MNVVDPQMFGEVKAKGEENEKRLDKIDDRFDRVDKKIDTVKWLVVANMVGGMGTVVYTNDSAKEVLLSFINLFV